MTHVRKLSDVEREACAERVMATHLVYVMGLKRVMAVQVYTVQLFSVNKIIPYFLSK